MTEFAGIFLVAIAAGLFGSMLGVGGGVIMVPVLTLVFGLPVKDAIATSMISVIATSAMGQLAFVRRGLTHARVGFLLEIASAAGAVLGGVVAVLVDARVLQVAFALVLLYVVWHMNRRKGDVTPQLTGVLEASYVDPTLGREVAYGVRRRALGFVFSLGAGSVAGLLGVGGGAFKVPIMNTLMGMPFKAAIATSNLMIGITAAAGAIIFLSRGFVSPAHAIPAALGILVGAHFGPRLAMRMSARALSVVFQLVLGLFAILMLLRAIGFGL